MGIYAQDHPANELTRTLKAYQTEKGLSRTELAAEIGVSHTILSKLEMKDLSLNEKTYKKIATFLGESPFEVIRMKYVEPLDDSTFEAINESLNEIDKADQE